MRILRLWVVTSFIFGVGEMLRAWFAFQNPDNTPKSIFQLRFWETLLAGSMQKIVSGHSIPSGRFCIWCSIMSGFKCYSDS
jgi:hypothetical protein